MTAQFDWTEQPLTEPQRTFIDCDKVPPITTFTEFLGCMDTATQLYARWHYKQLSPHDADELRYLQIRIQKYKETQIANLKKQIDEHETRTKTV